eukprot:g590.t1
MPNQTPNTQNDSITSFTLAMLHRSVDATRMPDNIKKTIVFSIANVTKEVEHITDTNATAVCNWLTRYQKLLSITKLPSKQQYCNGRDNGMANATQHVPNMAPSMNKPCKPL